jgi:PhnB protein
MPIEPYLFFNGRCDEAIAFYQQAIGARVEMLLRYHELPESCPEGPMPPDWKGKIMHASLDINGSRVMMSDGNSPAAPAFHGFALSLPLLDEAAAGRVFTALAEGGHVVMPLGKTFWSPCFGMVTDRFGILWQVTIPGGEVPA